MRKNLMYKFYMVIMVAFAVGLFCHVKPCFSANEIEGKININTATKEQLVLLNGIGDKLAGEIINYRKEKGTFTTIEAIKNVKGIGDKKFAKIKDYLAVDGDTTIKTLTNALKEGEEVKAIKKSKEAREIKEIAETIGNKDSNTNEGKEAAAIKESKEVKEVKEIVEIVGNKDPNESKNTNEDKDKNAQK